MQSFGIFLRKKKEGQPLDHFCNLFNGIYAKCQFGLQINGLIYNFFILNMKNMFVQKRLSPQPNFNLDFALNFTEPFEQVIKKKTIRKPQ